MKVKLNTGGQLVLASGSPRRRELLEEMGLEFRVQKSDVDESKIPADHPRTFAIRAAYAKAYDVAEKCNSGDIVLAADTVVTFKNIIYGKPAHEKEAAEILHALSGRTHQVITGFALAVVGKSDVQLDSCETNVIFLNLTEQQIDSYIKTGSPLDKAGAYGIQDLDNSYISGINGDYFNVVGLPCEKILNLLQPYLDQPEKIVTPEIPELWR